MADACSGTTDIDHLDRTPAEVAGMKRLWFPDPRYYLIAATAFVSIFCLIPLSLYAHSGEDWNFPWYLLLIPAGIGAVLFIGAAIAIRLLAIRHAGPAAIVAIALFCLGVFVLLAHVYTPLQIGPLDGSRLVSSESVKHAIIEMAILLLLALAFVQLVRGKGLTIATTFSLSLIILGFGYFLVNPLTGDEGVAKPRQQEDQASMRAQSPAPSIEGNVYHIVLDMMDTDAFLSTIDRLGWRQEFEGFDLFRNNISNYSNTVPSSASYFTGTFYHTGDFDGWARAWHERGLLSSLEEQGYVLWMYAPYPDWSNQTVDKFWDIIGIYEQEQHVEHTRFYEFVKIWVASIAPSFLANEALAAGDTIRRHAFSLFIDREAMLSGEDGLEPFASKLMLRRITREEARRPANGQYLYAHAVLPHGPEVLDGSCEYIGAPPPKRTAQQHKHAYLVHAECAVRLVVSFLQRLKKLGRYDPATIVLHADTGHWTAFEPEQPSDEPAPKTLDRFNRRLLSEVHSLLMIKRPHAAEPLRILDTPTQLVDLYPTLLEILNLNPPDYPLHGRSAYGPDANAPREARFGFDPNKHLGPNVIEFRIEDQSDLRNSDLTVIGPATDPDLWRPELKDRQAS
jgi:Sulfatase